MINNGILRQEWECNRCHKMGRGFHAVKTKYRIYDETILCLCPECFKVFPQEYVAAVLMEAKDG